MFSALGFMKLLLCVISLGNISQASISPCYDSDGEPIMCMPPFKNAAYNKQVQATNTCGVGKRTQYCSLARRSQCAWCDANTPELKHPPKYMTDFHSNFDATWWQSDSMFDGMQNPTEVNITLNLGM